MRGKVALVTILGLILSLPRIPAFGRGGRILYSDDNYPLISSTRIFSIRPDGTGRKRLTRTQSDSPAWSPNGRLIAFSSAREDTKKSPWALWVMRADGTGKRRVTPWSGGGRVSWAPSSKRFLYLIDPYGDPVMRIAYIDGRPTQRVPVPDDMEVQDPVWSPDGGRIAFWRSLEVAGTWVTEVWSVAPDGGNLQKLTDDGYHPAWSPDGSRIAFATQRDDTTTGEEAPYTAEVYVMNSDGSDEIRVSFDDHSLKRALAWSPGGQRIAYQARCHLDYCGETAVGVAHADGSGDTFVVDDLSDPFGPVEWSPKGRRILFERLGQAGDRLFTVDADDGSDMRRVWPSKTHPDQECCHWWDWSPVP